MHEPPRIGRRIRSRRHRCGLTLDDLADRSGLSRTILSQIESDKVNPTYQTLWKIAAAMDIDLSGMLHTSPLERTVLVRPREHIFVLDTGNADVRFELLSPTALADDFAAYLATLEPHARYASRSHPPGTDEFLTVLEGRIRVTVGETSANLGPEDTIFYEANADHTLENLTEARARIHLVVRYTGLR